MGFLCGFFKLIDFVTSFFSTAEHSFIYKCFEVLIIASTSQMVCEPLCVDQSRKRLCFFMLKVKTIHFIRDQMQ